MQKTSEKRESIIEKNKSWVCYELCDDIKIEFSTTQLCAVNFEEYTSCLLLRI